MTGTCVTVQDYNVELSTLNDTLEEKRPLWGL